MVLWKRVTVGELGVIVTMVVSLFLFLVKVGEWKATIERNEKAYNEQTIELRKDVNRLNRKVDDVSAQEDQYMDRLNVRLIRIETKFSKALGVPPYGPYNPPPIVKYREKEEQ